MKTKYKFLTKKEKFKYELDISRNKRKKGNDLALTSDHFHEEVSNKLSVSRAETLVISNREKLINIVIKRFNSFKYDNVAIVNLKMLTQPFNDEVNSDDNLRYSVAYSLLEEVKSWGLTSFENNPAKELLSGNLIHLCTKKEKIKNTILVNSLQYLSSLLIFLIFIISIFMLITIVQELIKGNFEMAFFIFVVAVLTESISFLFGWGLDSLLVDYSERFKSADKLVKQQY